MEVVLRAALAVFAGYGVAAIAQAVLARSLPMARIDATITATMASFAFYAAAAIWSFAARTATHALLGLLGSAVALGTLGWLAR